MSGAELSCLVLGAVGGCTLGMVVMAMLASGNRSALGPRERKVLDRRFRTWFPECASALPEVERE